MATVGLSPEHRNHGANKEFNRLISRAAISAPHRGRSALLGIATPALQRLAPHIELPRLLRAAHHRVDVVIEGSGGGRVASSNRAE